ncbi:hypothetical protein HYH03_012325 [Edaphochlamys debaryana]|uniref:Uncharacterized protein n=1 Tax=Edaphochlamys debaryana TaxID=47281 RepID=A0A836BVK3_9CHLO|nr:hypothetical protein HYH03_012325 [Edaphochlamys debaryana]|eukprot:KAG2489099.1 hypothetical protein HYH03_012325 [Edaphochlamys debaryana]
MEPNPEPSRLHKPVTRCTSAPHLAPRPPLALPLAHLRLLGRSKPPLPAELRNGQAGSEDPMEVLVLPAGCASTPNTPPAAAGAHSIFQAPLGPGSLQASAALSLPGSHCGHLGLRLSRDRLHDVLLPGLAEGGSEGSRTEGEASGTGTGTSASDLAGTPVEADASGSDGAEGMAGLEGPASGASTGEEGAAEPVPKLVTCSSPLKIKLRIKCGSARPQERAAAGVVEAAPWSAQPLAGTSRSADSGPWTAVRSPTHLPAPPLRPAFAPVLAAPPSPPESPQRLPPPRPSACGTSPPFAPAYAAVGLPAAPPPHALSHMAPLGAAQAPASPPLPLPDLPPPSGARSPDEPMSEPLPPGGYDSDWDSSDSDSAGSARGLQDRSTPGRVVRLRRTVSFADHADAAAASPGAPTPHASVVGSGCSSLPGSPSHGPRRGSSSLRSALCARLQSAMAESLWESLRLGGGAASGDEGAPGGAGADGAPAAAAAAAEACSPRRSRQRSVGLTRKRLLEVPVV